ncbi:FUSC family protein [Alloscardovia theropitheci]|uniref:FUSC family protein n=1 Tax=Alloscardovia theropitheci TaxID=2496842 RepID=UPI00196BA8E8|nr:FUSC family protein [Alloscardovia theropitheci]
MKKIQERAQKTVDKVADHIDKPRVTTLEIEVAIGIAIVAVVSLFSIHYMTTSMATAVVVCTQIDRKEARKAGLRRLIGTMFGGLSGLLVVALDDVMGNNPYIFVALAFTAIIIIGALFYGFKLPSASWKITMISLALVMLVQFGEDRMLYAIYRLIGTVLGVLLSIIITTVWAHTQMAIQRMRSAKIDDSDDDDTVGNTAGDVVGKAVDKAVDKVKE